MLHVNSIDLHYGAAQALRNVSLSAAAGTAFNMIDWTERLLDRGDDPRDSIGICDVGGI